MSTKFLHRGDLSPELLWKQFIKGDMASFREIYETNYQNLYSFGLQYLSANEVEDCIQNLFLYILQQYCPK